MEKGCLPMRDFKFLSYLLELWMTDALVGLTGTNITDGSVNKIHVRFHMPTNISYTVNVKTSGKYVHLIYFKKMPMFRCFF